MCTVRTCGEAKKLISEPRKMLTRELRDMLIVYNYNSCCLYEKIFFSKDLTKV